MKTKQTRSQVKRILLTLIILFAFTQLMQGQVLISLLFGDKLNSPTLKFGLDGGANFAKVTNNNDIRYHTGFNLGFYFDILLKKDKPWYIHTGVLVKSPMGVDNLDPYHLSNADSVYLDTLFADGYVDRQFRYFNVPILVRYMFRNDLFIEIGPMLGLMYKANDEFIAKVENDKDLSFNNKVIDQYKRFDVGGMAGIGYHIDYLNGMNFGFRYYYGFMDIVKDNTGDAQRNTSFYLYASIPIGAGDKAKAKQAAKKQEKMDKKGK